MSTKRARKCRNGHQQQNGRQNTKRPDLIEFQYDADDDDEDYAFREGLSGSSEFTQLLRETGINILYEIDDE